LNKLEEKIQFDIIVSKYTRRESPLEETFFTSELPQNYLNKTADNACQ